jgi:lipopolysaccharide export system ATP-binding protein
MIKSKLSLKGIYKAIAGKNILSDIGFTINSKEIVGLLGPNGAGKTSAFYIAAGLLAPDKGTITINDQDVTNLPMHLRSKVGLSYLPQESSIFQDLTVKENLNGIAELTMDAKEDRQEFVETLIDDFNLSEILHLKGRLLSGGQRRKVEIARALACNPSILLLDEPFAGIDPIAVLDIQKIITQLTLLGIGVLITDHNVRETLGICDRAYIVNQGEVLASGTPSEMVANEAVKNIYLGKNFVL